MNFKGSAFSAGSEKISDSVFKDGKIYFLQGGNSGYDLRSFDTAAKKFTVEQKKASFADKCFFYGEGLLELFGMGFLINTFAGG